MAASSRIDQDRATLSSPLSRVAEERVGHRAGRNVWPYPLPDSLSTISMMPWSKAERRCPGPVVGYFHRQPAKRGALSFRNAVPTAASPTSTSVRPARKSAVPSVAKRKPAAAGKPVPTRGRRTCAGRPTRSTGAASCRSRRVSTSISRAGRAVVAAIPAGTAACFRRLEAVFSCGSCALRRPETPGHSWRCKRPGWPVARQRPPDPRLKTASVVPEARGRLSAPVSTIGLPGNILQGGRRVCHRVGAMRYDVTRRSAGFYGCP